MKKLLEILCVISFFIGAGSGDSESITAPFLMVMISAIILLILQSNEEA